MDHEVGPWKMAFFHCPALWSDFFYKISLQSLWAPHQVYIKCGPRGMTMHQKVNVLFFLIYVQKGQVFINLLIKIDNHFVCFCLHLLFPNSQKYFFVLGPYFFLPKHLFCLSHRKPRWTMSVDSVSLKLCLLGTLNSIVALTFFFLFSV